jgi:hypothetical protein
LQRIGAILLSLALTVTFNAAAGILTFAHVNGSTIIETSSSSATLLAEFGLGAIVIRALEIATLYSLAYLLSAAVSSQLRVLSAKRIYLAAFSLLVALLPAASFFDMLNDILVVYSANDTLSGTGRITDLGLIVAAVVAGAVVARGWTLPGRGGNEWGVSSV